MHGAVPASRRRRRSISGYRRSDRIAAAASAPLAHAAWHQGCLADGRVRQRSRTRRCPNGASWSRCSRRPCGTAKTPPAVVALDLTVGLDDQLHTADVGSARRTRTPGHAAHHRCRRAALTRVHVVEAFSQLLGRY